MRAITKFTVQTPFVTLAVAALMIAGIGFVSARIEVPIYLEGSASREAAAGAGNAWVATVDGAGLDSFSELLQLLVVTPNGTRRPVSGRTPVATARGAAIAFELPPELEASFAQAQEIPVEVRVGSHSLLSHARQTFFGAR